jgi:type I restriction enzyme M protein
MDTSSGLAPADDEHAGHALEGKETVPNGNYLWINLFSTSLKPTGRAALVKQWAALDSLRDRHPIPQAP